MKQFLFKVAHSFAFAGAATFLALLGWESLKGPIVVGGGPERQIDPLTLLTIIVWMACVVAVTWRFPRQSRTITGVNIIITAPDGFDVDASKPRAPQ